MDVLAGVFFIIVIIIVFFIDGDIVVRGKNRQQPVHFGRSYRVAGVHHSYNSTSAYH